MQYKKIVIGIDQSYNKTGLSVCIDGKLVQVTSIDFNGLKSKSEKRKLLANTVNILLAKASKKASETVILCERIRTFSQGGAKGADKSGGLRPGYLKMTGALIASFVDVAFDYGVKVYSVDTRSWKSQVVGSSKNKTKDKKLETVEFIEKLGFNMFVYQNQKGRDIFDDDAADSACIALYGFIPVKKQKLLLEE